MHVWWISNVHEWLSTKKTGISVIRKYSQIHSAHLDFSKTGSSQNIWVLGDFNPSKWESSPKKGENKKFLKPPPRPPRSESWTLTVAVAAAVVGVSLSHISWPRRSEQSTKNERVNQGSLWHRLTILHYVSAVNDLNWPNRYVSSVIVSSCFFVAINQNDPIKRE